MAAPSNNSESAIKAHLARSLRSLEPIFQRAVEKSVTASTLLQALQTRPRVTSQTGSNLPGTIAELVHGKVTTFREDVDLLIDEMDDNERTIVSVLQSFDHIHAEIRDYERTLQERSMALIMYLLIATTDELDTVSSNTALSWMFGQVFPGLDIHAGH
ncbi:hypothetical protein DL546_004532 [Coniochaeta pulveracea]|uniref:Uncharacterized protein n=1 Tax=Coniochaeta pulveracea TaxID=177199 RepID=A0A420Y0Y1_9PEZI|nr:hypothetical protein DL546_004532 [Coniochaeta pulveracea]